MKDYLTVKEFSIFSGIEATTLRYWDEIGLFSPAKRDPENNYRYYTSEQIIAVHFIYVLSTLGVPLKAIGDLARDRSPEKAVRLIRQQEKWLDMEMRRLRECYSVIHTRLELIDYGMKVLDGFNVMDGVIMDNRRLTENMDVIDTNKISVLHRDEVHYIAGPENTYREGDGFYESFIHFGRKAGELRVNFAFPIAGCHRDADAFFAAPGKPQFYASIDPTGNCVMEGGDYLVGFTLGYYGQMGDLADRMEAYAKANALILSGPVMTTYLLDELSMKNPDQYLAQVSVAVTNR